MTTDSTRSPSWGTTTKLVVGLSLVALLSGLFIYFRSVFSLMIFAFIITYLLRPIVIFLTNKTNMSWRLSVTLLYVLLIILLMGLLTGAGLVIAQQLTSLVGVLQDFTENLPTLANDLTLYLEQFGLGADLIDLSDLANRALETLQPVLGQAGSIVGSIATGAATSIGRIFFVLIVSYFILTETHSVGNISIEQIPNYADDIRRMSRQLKIIWDTFFRGQIVIFMMVFIFYSMLLSVLGVRYSIALAAMAGLAVFIPYVGAWANSIVMVVVTILQPYNYFGLVPWQYALMVLLITLMINFIFDNYISPRFFGRTLDIHPAAVLVAALFLASLLGLIGIFLAAPVVATIKLLGTYTFRKMVDLDPWPDPEIEFRRIEFPWYSWFRKFVEWLRKTWSRIQKEKSEK